jgi:arylsulfatase
MIANIDENIGRLEAFLRDTGLRDNTIVLFLTDNGGTAGVKLWNAGLRAGKTTFYEGGHRVPCWIRWPAGNLGKPREIAEPAQMQDVLPTLLELCGVNAGPKPPTRAAFDGTSLAPLLRGSAEKLPDRMMVVQYSRAKLTKWECAVIWNQWRLVEGKELYDVRKDRAQKEDLADAHPDIVSKMRGHYEQWWAGLGAKPDQFLPCATLGAEHQPVVSLTSSDWQDVYCDNAGHVRRAVGGPRGGPWLVEVARAGNYEIALRRWPRETRLALGDSSGTESKALPITAGKVLIAGQELSAKAQPADQEIVIPAKLPAGQTTFRAWFQDAQGNDLSGAFFAYVRRTD